MANSFDRGEHATRITEEPQLIDAPEHPSVAELHAYLEGKRGRREMPDRADILPSEIVRFLPNIIIAEALNGGEDFRTRIFGTALVELLGEERTGMLLSEFAEEGGYATDPEAVQRRWLYVSRKALHGRKPVFVTVPFATSGRFYLVGHCIAAPLSTGGTGPTQVLGAMFIAGAD